MFLGMFDVLILNYHLTLARQLTGPKRAILMHL